MRCDGVIQCSDLSDEDGCNIFKEWKEYADVNKIKETNTNSELEFTSNEVMEFIGKTEYIKNNEIYEKCILSGALNSFSYPVPDPNKKLLYYLPSTKKNLTPISEHLTSIELFQCCTIPNYFILANMVCDGIVQCPDMSDECICFPRS